MPEINILFCGDVVGKPGREGLAKALPKLQNQYNSDLVIVNGENVAGGSGISIPTFEKMIDSGADVITSGDHIFRHRDFPSIIDDPRLLRPANFPKQASGKGWALFKTAGGVSIAVVNIIGRVFMSPNECPFETMEEILKELDGQASIVFVDFHAEATSEKVAMGWFLDGRVSAIVGTHTHIPTADARVLPRGTAYISDVGMSGPYDSVIGREPERVLQKLITGMPARFDVASKNVKICGVSVTVDAETGRSSSITPFQYAADSRF